GGCLRAGDGAVHRDHGQRVRGVPGDDRGHRPAPAGAAARGRAGDPRRDRHAHRLLRHAAHADGRELQPGARRAAGTRRPQRRDPHAGGDRAAADGGQHPPHALAGVSMTVLLTGFAPFGDDETNPSWDAVRLLHGRRVAGHRLEARCLPVAFGASLTALRAAIRELRPRVVVCTGLAAGRAHVSLERIAINVDDARIPDNAGASPVDEPVVPDGPAAYFATLPIKAIVEAMRKAGIPAAVSQTAGTYVCNHVFYGLMHALR